ncbi:MAG: rod shape-determining protein RodA [Planctomycetes bacterium]|nr:rod shape-determining protein RodA [Planctomycetota bacterium]
MSRSPGYETRRRGLARLFSTDIEWSRFDWHLLTLALLLCGAGLLSLHAMAEADARFDRAGGPDFEGQLQKLALALPCLLAGLHLRTGWLRRHAWWIGAAALLLLVLVPIIGQERNHARRWIPLPIGFDLQPSELAKVALVVVLAKLLYRSRLDRARDWLLAAAAVLVPMVLVARQPDLGTALCMAPIALGVLYLAGASARRLGLLCACFALLALCAVQFEWVRDYQLQRVRTWLGTVEAAPLIDARNGAAFHVYHARVAIGNGGWFGTGLGRGVSNVAGHLPERDCDSAFAVLAEEGGWFGMVALIGGYLLLCVGLLHAASAQRERFSRLVVGGVGLYFAAHLFIHAGVNLGLVPLTGLPLPLFSTGGSSLLASFTALGLALGTSARREAALDEDSFRD